MAYLYDAMLLAIESVRKFGPDSQAIKTGFKSIKFQWNYRHRGFWIAGQQGAGVHVSFTVVLSTLKR